MTEKIDAKKIDTVIFDLGAVLAAHGRPKDVLESYGIPYGDVQHGFWREYKLGSITERQFWERILEGSSKEPMLEEVMQKVRDHYCLAIPEGAYRFVQPLKDNGLRVAILSNHSKEWGRGSIQTLGLDRLCDPIMISAEIGLAKPDIRIYRYALSAVGREENPGRCLFIDDKKKNVDAAVKAGMNGIVYIGPDDLQAKLVEYGALVR